LTIGSSGAEGICPSSQTHAQLLRRVVILGRRTIRWLLSPRSISAPTVRPTLVFLHRRFIRRNTDTLVPPVITVRRDSSRSQTLITRRRARAVRRRPARLRRPTRKLARLCILRRPSAAPRAHHRPPRLSAAHNRAPPPPQPRVRVTAAAAFPGRLPPQDLAGVLPGTRRARFRLHSFLSSLIQAQW
jgi:hypothetical protein